MAVTFLIPGPLRPFADDQRVVRIEQPPATVGDALQILCAKYPGVRDRILTEQGQIRKHINVFVGQEDIRYTGGPQTQIADGAEISIFPAISGG